MSQSAYRICSLASHTALQIFKGAHDEGFGTVAICEQKHLKTYQSFKLADEIIAVDSFSELPKHDEDLFMKNAIMIPHGSLINALSFDQIVGLKTKYFGNRQVLAWESDRAKQREWLLKAGLTLPKVYGSPDEIDRPVIVKFDGAGGGKGYFLAHSPDEFRERSQGMEDKHFMIQEYVIGSPIYIHYFYSPITGELEIMSFDKRYESNVDGIGRVPAQDQLDMKLNASFTITGNIPLVVRESLLSGIIAMGEQVVEASKSMDGVGLFGPFCLETIITQDLEFVVFEISARIVAGTNPYIGGSPYTDLRYDVPMSTGRRIAREIRLAYSQNKLETILK